ncbi:uncharacterized protein Hap1MRO34_004906 [Clarias gariepinus]
MIFFCNFDVALRARPEGTALKISSLKNSDVGIYTCNDFTPGHTLYVASAQANPPTVLYSSETHLTCDVGKDFTKGTYQWLTPNSAEYSKSKAVTVKPVTSDHSGSWTCQIKDETGNVVLSLKVDLSVVGMFPKIYFLSWHLHIINHVLGPLNTQNEVMTVMGHTAVLPCFLSTPSKIRITGGSWTRDTSTKIRLPTLMSNQGGLQWNNTGVTIDKRVSFSKEKLNSDFNVTLKEVKPADAGEYTCRLEFQGGSSLTAKLNLTVLNKDGAASSIDYEEPNYSNKIPWKKHLGGLQLWVWVAVAASSLVLIGLVVIIVLIHRRNKRMKRKIKKTKSMQQPLTSRNYCKCGRTVRQPGTGRKERPPPLPRHQYSTLNN